MPHTIMELETNGLLPVGAEVIVSKENLSMSAMLIGQTIKFVGPNQASRNSILFSVESGLYKGYNISLLKEGFVELIEDPEEWE